MKQEELKQFESSLYQRKRNIQSALSSEGEVQSQSHRSTSSDDYADEAQICEQLEISSQIVTAEAGQLRKIDEALSRIKSGSYGKCDGCGEEIAIARLEALPFALNCRECQSELDKQPLT